MFLVGQTSVSVSKAPESGRDIEAAALRLGAIRRPCTDLLLRLTLGLISARAFRPSFGFPAHLVADV
jgi:hypothetical protein